MSINNYGFALQTAAFDLQQKYTPAIPSRIQYTEHDFWLDTPVPESIRQIWETNSPSLSNTSTNNQDSTFRGKLDAYATTVKKLGIYAPKTDQDLYIHNGIRREVKKALKKIGLFNNYSLQIDVDKKTWSREDLKGSFAYVIDHRRAAENGAPGIRAKVYNIKTDQGLLI